MYHKYDEPDFDGEEGYYGVHEYYEMEDGDGWTETPMVTGNSIEDVKKALILMLKDIDKHGLKNYVND